MKILIVEDDENKRGHIESFLRVERRETDVHQAASVISALQMIRSHSFDLIILDMTLPNYDIGEDRSSGGMHAFGGEEVLRQMNRFKISTPVIVFTQFETFGKPPDSMNLEELNQSMHEKFPRTYKGAVYYHAAIHDWTLELGDMIESIRGGSEQ